jgi:hypothetical protein
VTLGADEIFSGMGDVRADAIQRASVLLAMSRSWATLGNQIEMYETSWKRKAASRSPFANKTPETFRFDQTLFWPLCFNDLGAS